jgi:adenylyltransferase/sulfurtransferase
MNQPEQSIAPHSGLPDQWRRYSRQIRFSPIGMAGQQLLNASSVLVIGCGALGSVVAELLVRAGVGRIRIVDRDFVELHNLQRQFLYTEEDVTSGWPKAIAAAKRLRSINSAVHIDPVIADVDHRNIAALAEGAQVFVDGTDNFEIRFLINDFAHVSGTPWVYGGCLGAEGQSMTIIPGETACLRCLLSEGAPPPGTTPGCDVGGIVGPVINVIAAIQSMEAIKLLSGNRNAINSGLTIIDLWGGRMRQMDLSNLRALNLCPACLGQHEWLEGRHATRTALLCGQNSVQIRAAGGCVVDLQAMALRLAGVGDIRVNEYLLKLDLGDHQLTVFPDGRAIVSGTEDVGKARSLYAQWVGS